MGAPNLHCPNSSSVPFSLGERRGPLPRGHDDVLQRLQRTTPRAHGCSSWPRLILRATPPRPVSQSVSCHRSSAVSSEPLASGQKPRTLGGFRRFSEAGTGLARLVESALVCKGSYDLFSTSRLSARKRHERNPARERVVECVHGADKW